MPQRSMCANMKSKVQNCGLEDRKTVSSDTPFFEIWPFEEKKNYAIMKRAWRCFLVESIGPKFRSFFASDAPFSRCDSLKCL